MTTTPSLLPASSGAPPRILPDALSSQRWAHVTSRFRSLGMDAEVRTTDPVLGRYLDRAFRDISATGRARTMYSLITTAPEPWPYVLYKDDDRLSFSADGAHVVDHLLWDLNQMAVREAGNQRLLLHAGAVERRGIGIVLPGSSGDGKTTLTAGLILSGARYLSDEIAAVGTRATRIHPHPGPLVIKRGSWHALGDLRPSRRDLLPTYLPDRWHVPASSIRLDALAGPVEPRLVIVPRYAAGRSTTLESVSRANMIVHLAAATFGPRDRNVWTLQRLRDLVAGAACHALTYSDLGDACRTIARLTDAAVGEPNR